MTTSAGKPETSSCQQPVEFKFPNPECHVESSQLEPGPKTNLNRARVVTVRGTGTQARDCRFISNEKGGIYNAAAAGAGAFIVKYLESKLCVTFLERIEPPVSLTGRSFESRD